MQPLIQLTDIHRIYSMGDLSLRALDGVNLSIHHGDFVTIMGASGSGKSTLLNIIGCLDTPSSGTYHIDNKEAGALGKDGRADIRNSLIGFVFQNFNLLARTTAVENVELPLHYRRGHGIHDMASAARHALERVGLGKRLHHTPSQLSGGQQQRVAIARALVNDPPLILADEPTGALDSATSIDIMKLFQHLNAQGKTVVVVTHEPDIAMFSKRLIRMRDGRIISDEPVNGL